MQEMQGSIPGLGTRIPHAMEHLGSSTTTTEPSSHNSRVHAPQWKIPCAPTKTQHIQINKCFLKRKENIIHLTCRYNLSPFNLLSNFSNLFACSGTSSFIFIMHLVSRTTSKILGSKLTSNFPVSGCRTKSVACKATNKQLLTWPTVDFCFQSCLHDCLPHWTTDFLRTER